MKVKSSLVWLMLLVLAAGACSEESAGFGGTGRNTQWKENFKHLSEGEFRDKVVDQIVQYLEKNGIEPDEAQHSAIRRLAEGTDWSGDRNRDAMKAIRLQLFEQVRQQVLTEEQRETLAGSQG